jgi:hypothetical protein
MELTQVTRPPHDAPNWDWRRELKTLDAAIADVERQGAWDWQRDLAELEAGLDQLAHKYGLAEPA